MLQGSVPNPWTQPEKNSAPGALGRCILRGDWELEREFPFTLKGCELASA